MSARKAQRRPKAQRLYFYETDRSLPIAGLPAPRPCPFCGETDAEMVFDDSELEHGSRRSAHVQCGNCLAEAPGAVSLPESHMGSYQLAEEAARQWNERGRSKARGRE